VEAPSEMFVTAFYAVLDPMSRSLTYANAGHDPPFLRSTSGVQRLALGGLIMGLFEELSLKDETLSLGSGDALIAYTDGLTDAVNDRDQHYGDSRLVSTINNAPVAAQDILAHILQDLEAFAGSAPRPDDVTLLILTAD
jgi:phosphoserine phosphatase RsbU/P